MEAVLAFLRAALPWVLYGLLMAVLLARQGTVKQKDGQDDNYGLEGMGFGMCLGLCLGASFGNNTGIGIAMGMLTGLAIGTCIPKEERGEGDDPKA